MRIVYGLHQQCCAANLAYQRRAFTVCSTHDRAPIFKGRFRCVLSIRCAGSDRGNGNIELHRGRRVHAIGGSWCFVLPELVTYCRDDGGPTAGCRLMKQCHGRIPHGFAPAFRPSPVAIGMQHGPHWRPESAGKMSCHRVDGDDQIELQDSCCQCLDIRRGDVPGWY